MHHPLIRKYKRKILLTAVWTQINYSRATFKYTRSFLFQFEARSFRGKRPLMQQKLKTVLIICFFLDSVIQHDSSNWVLKLKLAECLEVVLRGFLRTLQRWNTSLCQHHLSVKFRALCHSVVSVGYINVTLMQLQISYMHLNWIENENVTR